MTPLKRGVFWLLSGAALDFPQWYIIVCKVKATEGSGKVKVSKDNRNVKVKVKTWLIGRVPDSIRSGKGII